MGTIDSISSKEVAERFGKVHRNVIRDIKKLINHDGSSSSLFTESTYVTEQNKTLMCFDMSFGGFSLLTDTQGYCRGRNASVKSEIINEFGEPCVVLSDSRERSEDLFHDMLAKATNGVNIIRQYRIAGYRVDFYMPDFCLFIEYDEEHHLSRTNKRMDDARWAAIREHVRYHFDDGIALIRVDKGDELAGIGAIIGFMAYSTLDATGATGIYDRYIEKKKQKRSPF